MAIQSNKQQLKKAAEFFQPAKKSVVMRSEFADQLEQQLVEKHITFTTDNDMETKSFWQNPRLKWGGLALGALATVLVIGGVYFNSNQTQNLNGNSTLGAELAYTIGDVEYSRGDEDWTTVEMGMDLQEGDAIRTLGDSRAIINLDDGSAVRLNYDSEVALTSLDPQDMQVTNMEGEVYARVAKLDRDFTIVTDEIDYLSLGTAYTTINTEDKKGVKVFHSKVQVSDKDLDKTLLVNEGEEFYKGEEEAKELTIEEIKKDEFALWNKEQDEKNSAYQEDLGKFTEVTLPELTLIQPEDGQVIKTEKLKVKGETEVGATVKVNGDKVTNNDGAFSKEIKLVEGENKIQIIVIDAMDNQVKKTIKVTYKPETETNEVSSTSSKTSSASSSASSSAQPAASITITSVTPVDGGIKVQWTISNGTASQGFKVAYSTSANPSYPANSALYVSDASARSAVVNLDDGKTYHFRVGRYVGGSCDLYSNDVTATAPTVPEEEAISSITSFSFNGTNKLTWDTNTGGVADGFKVAYSATDSDPHYPAEGVAYTANKYHAISENGFYRICAWDGDNGCTAESSVIEVTSF